MYSTVFFFVWYIPFKYQYTVNSVVNVLRRNWRNWIFLKGRKLGPKWNFLKSCLTSHRLRNAVVFRLVIESKFAEFCPASLIFAVSSRFRGFRVFKQWIRIRTFEWILRKQLSRYEKFKNFQEIQELLVKRRLKTSKTPMLFTKYNHNNIDLIGINNSSTR